MSIEMVKLVQDVINEVLLETGLEQVEMNANTNILADTNLDSIGLAITIVKLEEKTNKDPFVDGFVMFHTISELAALYV